MRAITAGLLALWAVTVLSGAGCYEVAPPPAQPDAPAPEQSEAAIAEPRQTLPVGPGGKLDKMTVEWIDTLNEMAEVMSTVTDEQSARAAAPKHLPLMRRQAELSREIAIARLRLSPEELARWEQEYTQSVDAAGRRVGDAQARFAANRGLLRVWVKAVGEVRKSMPPPTLSIESIPADVRAEILPTNRKFAAIVTELHETLAAVQDESSAKAAAPALRESADTLREVVKRHNLILMAIPQELLDELPEVNQADPVVEFDAFLNELFRVGRGPGAVVLRAEIAAIRDELISRADMRPSFKEQMRRELGNL